MQRERLADGLVRKYAIITINDDELYCGYKASPNIFPNTDLVSQQCRDHRLVVRQEVVQIHGLADHTFEHSPHHGGYDRQSTTSARKSISTICVSNQEIKPSSDAEGTQEQSVTDVLCVQVEVAKRLTFPVFTVDFPARNGTSGVFNHTP